MAEGRSEHPSNDASLHQTPRSEHILPAIWTSAAPDDVLDGLSEPASRAPEPAPSRQIPLPDPFSPPLDASITRDFNFGATPGLAANPRQVVPLHEPELADPGLSPTSDPWSAGSDPGSPSKLLPQRHNDLASDDGDDYGLAEPSDASDSSTDPDPMPQQIPRRVTIQLRNVFEHYRRKFKQNPLTLRFRDRGVEAHFEAVMNEGTAFVNSLLIMLGSGQLALVLIWEYFAWGPDSVKFRAVWPYQVAMLVVCLASGILIYSVRVLRERQRLIWSIVYGIIVFVLFVVMDTAEHVSWHPTAEEPVEVFVSGNLMVLLFVYTSTLQVPTLNAAVAVLFCLGAHVLSYAIFVPQSLTRGYIPSITVYFTSCLVGLAGGWLRERNARERVLMERFTRTRIVASLAEGLQAMRSEASGLGASQSEDFGWMAKAAAWVRRGSRRVQPEGADGMAAPVRLLANPWLWFRSRVLLIFRDPAFENTFRVYHNHHHALSIFRIETAFIAVTTAIHAVLDYTTYHEFLISELDFKMWLAVTAIVCIAGFFASFSSAVRRRPVVFQSICWFANMAILQVVLVLYTTNRHMHDRNVYAPIAVEIILAAAGESGMRVAWFLSFAAVVLLASISKVAAGAAGMRELLDVGFPCLVGIVYGILAEGEIRRWYVVRQRALLKVPGINRYNGKIGSSWEEV